MTIQAPAVVTMPDPVPGPPGPIGPPGPMGPAGPQGPPGSGSGGSLSSVFALPALTCVRSGVATVWDSAGNLVVMPANTLRTEYDPENGDRLGVVIEAAEQNRLTQSDLLTDSSWNRDQVTVALDGTLVGRPRFKITKTTTATNGALRKLTQTYTAGQPILISGLVQKCPPLNVATLGFFCDSNGNYAYVAIDLTTGILSLPYGTGAIPVDLTKSRTRKLVNATDAWEFLITLTPAAATSHQIQFIPASAVVGEAVYLAALSVVQNAGRFSTYIPTGAAAVSRAADTVTVDLAARGLTTVGTVLVEALANDRITITRRALAWQPGAYSVIENGVIVATGTDADAAYGVISNPIKTLGDTLFGGLAFRGGILVDVQTAPVKLSDAELIQLTISPLSRNKTWTNIGLTDQVIGSDTYVVQSANQPYSMGKNGSGATVRYRSEIHAGDRFTPIGDPPTVNRCDLAALNYKFPNNTDIWWAFTFGVEKRSRHSGTFLAIADVHKGYPGDPGEPTVNGTMIAFGLEGEEVFYINSRNEADAITTHYRDPGFRRDFAYDVVCMLNLPLNRLTTVFKVWINGVLVVNFTGILGYVDPVTSGPTWKFANYRSTSPEINVHHFGNIVVPQTGSLLARVANPLTLS